MRAALLALLVASAALAGCAEEAPPPTPTSQVEPLTVTDENDAEALANESFMMEAHRHDYWGGAERLTIVDREVETGGTWFGGVLVIDFVPDDGVVVPQGTEAVEVTLSWTRDTDDVFDDPEVWVKTAAQHEAALLGPAEPDGTLRLATTLADADLPHQTISAWRFEWHLQPGLVPGDALPGVRYSGTVTVKVEAVRGLEIPVYPPHPDLWQGADAIELFEDERPMGLWFGSIDGWSCFMGCPIVHRPVNGTVVPYDAAAVEVRFTPGEDALVELRIEAHGGDTRAWTELEPTSTEGRTQVYLIPVALGMGDSPYATQSVWEMAIRVVSPEKDGAVVGSYTMSARALRQAP